MADYWMKLYIEILDDPKMATLPDRVWRRIIELFLVAKRTGKDGYIPDTRQIAWMLRMSPDELESDMAQIAQTGIIERVVNGWFIPKFNKRQSASSNTERVQQFRKREQHAQYNDDETNVKRFVTQSTEYRVQNTEAEVDPTPTSPADWMTPQMEAQRIIQQVTNLAASPPDQIEKYTELILRLKDQHNSHTVDYLKPFYDDWCGRKTKDGKPYKRTALGWVEWALEGTAPTAPKVVRRRKEVEVD